MNMKTFYLILAIVGAVVPFIFFFRHFGSAGFSLFDFVDALFVTPAAAGFTVDLLITSFVFWVAMIQRSSHGQGPKPALFVVLNLLIGLSCALPAYLYANEKAGGSERLV